ncbi:phosphohistidine phosphatase SixA [Agitococcus lubricus]|uniref:Phosphohistidine phosphatase SixA n=1 Tax=Agitococcus lubricus TaxID=1077255 RepID=A0A2T5J1I2_9GAMM|nr:phosphohistidine phosphatase SixA [Agitococcus lubricus]PTQ90302.1 phosphohistidine phosphatase SixA [Agitococcus lubricus]
MQIILIRHGQAESQKTTDAARQLTAIGEWQAQQTAAWLLNHGYQLDGLFASPYVRAQQTAYHIGQALDMHMSTTDLITPDSDPTQAIAWLDSLELPETASIALVCHMPIVGRLASYFLAGTTRHDLPFYLAEAKVIELPVLAAGLGKTVTQFVPPEHPI